MELDMDRVWYWWSVAQRIWDYAIVIIAINFVWTFTRRVQRRSAKAQEKLRAGQAQVVEMNNNTTTFVNSHQTQMPLRRGTGVSVCHKGTQWEEQPRRMVNGKVSRGGAEEKEERLTGTALKIKQLMTNTSATRSSDKRSHPVKTGNGHVSDLKMRFEDRDAGELKHFQKAVDSVKVMNRFASPKRSLDHRVQGNGIDEDYQVLQKAPRVDANEAAVASDDENNDCSESEMQCSGSEAEEESPVVVLRRNKRIISKSGSMERLNPNLMNKCELMKEFGGSVHSLEDILKQQRFSRSLSQYSVSELCCSESPAEISRNCDRFDELFCRSTEDLASRQQREALY